MKLEIAAPLQEVASAYSARPVGKVTTLWKPDRGAGKVAVIQSEEYAFLLQAWTSITLLLEEVAPGTTVVEVKLHLGGGGLMKVSFGTAQKVYDRLLKSFSTLTVRVIDPE